MLFASIIIILLISIELCFSNTYCDNENECKGITISDNNNIYCRGYYSCSESNINSEGITYCDGNNGCYNSNINYGEVI